MIKNKYIKFMCVRVCVLFWKKRNIFYPFSSPSKSFYANKNIKEGKETAISLKIIKKLLEHEK